MRCERFALAGDPGELAQRVRALVPAPESVREAVAEMIAAVRTQGDAAVLDYTRRFDTAGADPKALWVDTCELDAAVRRLEHSVREALEIAIDHVRRVADALDRQDKTAVGFPGHEVSARYVPLSRAAVYVPGGRAPYPSTVVMGVVPAIVAGVGEIAVCSPPGRDGEIESVVLAACALAGVSSVYRMGGAQAIAALAYGTESVTAVDVIVGPGNLYVQEAKRQVFGQVGVDGFAGPSDLLVIADGDADAELISLDLLAQAEHGPGTVVVTVSTERELLDAIAARLDGGADTAAIACLIEADRLDAALELSEAFAPEHLQLVGAQAEALSDGVTRAGCVFVGAQSGTAFGDYIAGSNHILPTDATARFASAVSPELFRRRVVEVRVSDAGELARNGAAIARAEGFEWHARSMEARIRDNPGR